MPDPKALRQAIDAIALDDDTLDALAIERVVAVLWHEAAEREGRSVNVLLSRVAHVLGARQDRGWS